MKRDFAAIVIAVTTLVGARAIAAPSIMPVYVAAVVEKVEPGFSPYQKRVTIKVDKLLFGTGDYRQLFWRHCYEGAQQDAPLTAMMQRRAPGVPRIGAHVIIAIDTPASPSACDNFVIDDTPAARVLTVAEATAKAQVLATMNAAAAFKEEKAKAWFVQSAQQKPPSGANFVFVAAVKAAAGPLEPVTRLALQVISSIKGSGLAYGNELAAPLSRAFVGHPLLYRQGELLTPCVIVYAKRVAPAKAGVERVVDLITSPQALMPCATQPAR